MNSRPKCQPRSISRGPSEARSQSSTAVTRRSASKTRLPRRTSPHRRTGARSAGTWRRAPVERLRQRRQRVALRGPLDVGGPALDRVAQLASPAAAPPRPCGLPVDGVDVGHGVDQLVVHDALERGPGVAHVGIEERAPARGCRRATRGMTRKGEPIHAGSVDDHGRRRCRHARRGDGVLHQRLRAEVVVGEGGLQRRQPHHHARMGGTEVDEDGLVGLPALARARAPDEPALPSPPRTGRSDAATQRPARASGCGRRPSVAKPVLAVLRRRAVAPVATLRKVDDGPPPARHLGPAQAVPARTHQVDDVALGDVATGVRTSRPRRAWSWRTTHPSGTVTPASARRATALPPGRVHEADRQPLGRRAGPSWAA